MGVTKDIKEIKDNLSNIINFMDKNPSMFVKNPNSDFTRNRKMDFKDTINTIISIGGNSIKSELLELSNYSINTITSSGFCGQRDKILPESFKFLFDEFTDTIQCNKTYKGYRLLACDGSNLNIYRNPDDETTYIQSGAGFNSKGHNSLHLNVLYDILNHTYTDIIIQDIKNMNEKSALNTMIDRYNCNNKTIIIADRGYESYNVFAHAIENDLNFLIRVKDICSKFSISGTFNLPNTEFDTTISIVLSKKQTKKAKTTIHNYKFVSSSSIFDYLDLYENFYYPMSFRIVRFKITNNTYETIITNLNQDEFTINDIKELYGMRWGIETSFRELKYNIGLINLHSKRKDFIYQEIYARLTLYNMCQAIINKVYINNKNTKHIYKINMSMAFNICKKYFKIKNFSIRKLIILIKKYIEPIRKGRSDPRKLRPKGTIAFHYRIA